MALTTKFFFLIHNFTKPSCFCTPVRPSCGGEDTFFFLGGGCTLRAGAFLLGRTAGWWDGDSKLRGYSVPRKLVFALNIHKLRILKMFWAQDTAPEKLLRCFSDQIRPPAVLDPLLTSTIAEKKTFMINTKLANPNTAHQTPGKICTNLKLDSVHLESLESHHAVSSTKFYGYVMLQ